MVDSTAIIGTIDLVATRLSKLSQPRNSFITNPKRYKNLSLQCIDFKIILENVIHKLQQSTSLHSHKKDELDAYLKLTASVFDKAKQDLLALEESLSNLVLKSSTTDSASSSSQVSTPVTSQSTITKVRNQLRSFRLTQILDFIENYLSNEKDYPLQISNYIDTIQKTAIVSPGFLRHFDKPSMPVNCVFDFSTPTTTNGSISDLSHEAILKQEIISLSSHSNKASSSSDRSHTVQLTTANVRSIGVWGAGGVGKSVALQALCRDEEVKQYFEDGIHFLTFGQEANVGDVITELALCVRNAGFPSLEKEMLEMSSDCDAAKKGSIALKGKKVLLIADDLWGTKTKPIGYFREIQHFASQLQDGMIILSTRDETIAQAADRSVHFDYLSPQGLTSKRILKAPLIQMNIRDDIFEILNTRAAAALVRLLDLCGGWKLCLALAGSGLAEDIRDYGDDVELAVTMYTERLELDGQLLSSEGIDNYQSLKVITATSIGICRDWGRKSSIRKLYGSIFDVGEMFRSLCVIGKQKWIHLPVLLRLWKIGNRLGKVLVKQFARMNLISLPMENESENELEWVISVHDRLIDVCSQFAERREIKVIERWQRRFLLSYFPTEETVSNDLGEIPMRRQVSNDMGELPWMTGHPKTCREWWDEERIKEKYIIRNVSRHLIGAGLWKELLLLVTDVRWTLRRRLEGGWIGLKEDFDRVLREWEREEFCSSVHEIEGLQILRDTIRDSWSQIMMECRRIGFQVFGRIPMRHREYKVVKRYLNSIEENGPSPWLCPIIPVLQRNDGRQISQAGIPRNCRKTSISRDGNFAVTAKEAKLFITDLMKPDTRCFANCDTNITNFELLDNHLVVCILENGQILIWNAKSDSLVTEIKIKSEVLESEWEMCYCREGQFLSLFSTYDILKISLGKGATYGQIFNTNKLITVHLTGRIENQSMLAADPSICIWKLSETAVNGDGQADAVLTNFFRLLFNNGVAVLETAQGLKNLSLSKSLGQNPHRLHFVTTRICSISNNCKFVILSTRTWFGLWNSENGSFIPGLADGFERDRLNKILNREVDSILSRPVEELMPAPHVLAISDNGRFVLYKPYNGTLVTWDVQQNCDISQRLDLQNDAITCIEFREDNLYAALGSGNGSISIWDMTTCAVVGKPLDGHRHSVSYMKFSNDHRYLISGSYDGTVRWWDLQKDSFSGDYSRHDEKVTYITFSTDGHYLASGSMDNSIRIWDTVKNAAVPLPLTEQDNPVRCIAFDETSQKLISGSDDDTIRIWDINKTSLVRELKSHSAYTTSVEFSPCGQYILSASKDGTMQVWDSLNTATHTVHRQYERDEEKKAKPIATFSPNGMRVALINVCNRIQVYDTESGQRTVEYKLNTNLNIRHAMCSDTSPFIFFVSFEGILRIWNFESESESEVMKGLKLDSTNLSDQYSEWVISLTEYAFKKDSTKYCTCSQKLHLEVSSFLCKIGHVVEHAFWCSCGGDDGSACKGALDTDQERFLRVSVNESSVYVDNHQLVDMNTFASSVGVAAARSDLIAHGLDDGTVLICRIER